MKGVQENRMVTRNEGGREEEGIQKTERTSASKKAGQAGGE
jgi:hypothetical protein